MNDDDGRVSDTENSSPFAILPRVSSLTEAVAISMLLSGFVIWDSRRPLLTLGCGLAFFAILYPLISAIRLLEIHFRTPWRRRDR